MSTGIKVVRVPIVPLGVVNAFLVIGPQGAVLVDTGLPGTVRKVERALRREGLGPADLKLIVVTHAHVDHAGGAAELRERTGAPILAHEGDAPFYSREASMGFCTTDWFSRLFLRTGFIRQPYRGFVPDILLRGDQSFDLSAFGVPGLLRPTAGHTAGSIALELATREAIVGDLVASGILIGGLVRRGRAKRPPFEDDPARVAAELERLLASGVEAFHMGHGGPLPAREVARHARRLKELGRPAEPR